MSYIYSLKDTVINKSTRFFETDMRYVLGGGFWLFFGGILSALISFISAVAFANLLPKEAYGTYQYILSMSSILAIPTLAGINTAVTQSVARGYDKTVIIGLKTRIMWGFGSTILALGLASYYWFNGNNILATGFLVSSLFLPISETLGIYVPYLQGKKKFKNLSLYELGAQGLSALFLIGTIYLTKDLVIIVAVFFISWIIARLLFLNISLKKFPPITEIDPKAMNYGKHLTSMGILTTISSNLDKILLWKILGPVQVASYIFSLTIPLKVSSFTKIINRLAFPKIAEKKDYDIARLLLPKIGLVSLFLVLVTIIYITATPTIFKIFFPQYLDSVKYAQLAGLLISLQPLSLLSSALTAQAKKRELYIFNTLSPILRIILFIVLIPSLHLFGAIIATISSKILDGIILIHLTHKSKVRL